MATGSGLAAIGFGRTAATRASAVLRSAKRLTGFGACSLLRVTSCFVERVDRSIRLRSFGGVACEVKPRISATCVRVRDGGKYKSGRALSGAWYNTSVGAEALEASKYQKRRRILYYVVTVCGLLLFIGYNLELLLLARMSHLTFEFEQESFKLEQNRVEGNRATLEALQTLSKFATSTHEVLELHNQQIDLLSETVIALDNRSSHTKDVKSALANVVESHTSLTERLSGIESAINQDPAKALSVSNLQKDLALLNERFKDVKEQRLQSHSDSQFLLNIILALVGLLVTSLAALIPLLIRKKRVELNSRILQP